jgi:hypothetical protein
MKNLFLFLILPFLAVSCSNERKSIPTHIQVTVMDQKTNSPVDHALVSLITMIDARDVYTTSAVTDASGRCKFRLPDNPRAECQVTASKEGFQAYYDINYANLVRSTAYITEKTGNKIQLWLTSDPKNHETYWTQNTIHFAIDSLVNMLKSDQYPDRSRLPLLEWEEIPELLAIGNNSTLITHYPVSPVSSSMGQERFLGIVSLWFIESARKTELNQTLDPIVRFPSLTPALRYKGNENLQPNSPQIMERAFQAYQAWWNTTKKLDKKEACKINPLENINICWF